MTNTQLLNQRLAESLGRPNGTDPRFAWKFAPDVFYLFRASGVSTFERRSWGERVGKCWMLCQWRPPEITRDQWAESFGASYPYPARGEYMPHAETALPAGMEPTADLTYGYIRTIADQMDRAEQALADNYAGRKDATTEMCEREAQAPVDQAESEFYDMIGDREPLSWKLGEPREPGDQDGAVAFQVGGSRDEVLTGATA